MLLLILNLASVQTIVSCSFCVTSPEGSCSIDHSIFNYVIFFVCFSTLETTFDTNVTTEISGRSILSLTGRPTPLSWRLGQSSPRLQAGDAPSMGNGYPPRGNASRFINTESGRYMYSAPLRRQLATRGSNVCHVDISDKGSDEIDLEGITMDATGYMSDGDVLGKNIRTDDITSG